jgi:hypothetical protein
MPSNLRTTHKQAYPHGLLFLIASNFVSSHQEKASSGDICDFWWRSYRFKSRLEHRLYPSVVFFSPSNASEFRSRQLPSPFFRIHPLILSYQSTLYILSIDSIIKYTMSTRVVYFWTGTSHYYQTLREKQALILCFLAFYAVNHFVRVSCCIQSCTMSA